MLRLEFSAGDLGRVRVASEPHPLWELALGLNTLQSPRSPRRYRDWRSGVLRAARSSEETRRSLAAAAALVPAAGPFPDFLTPPLPIPEADAHFEAILSTPRGRVRADLDRTWSRHAPPAWAKALYRDERLEGIVDVLRRCHTLLVEPLRLAGDLQVGNDRARFAELLLDGGTEHLLGNLHPSTRWRNPVLEGDYPVDRTIRLRGRGLLVVPTYFCWDAPVTYIDADRPPVLVLPAVASTLRTPDVVDAAMDRLTRLLGPVRARVLRELVAGGSTTDLATRLDVSLATASQHAKVLREARLVATARCGQSVRHVLTPLGRRLFES